MPSRVNPPHAIERVILIDDQTRYRSQLRQLIEQQIRVTVVAEGADGSQARRLVAALRPDAVLISASMRSSSGAEIARWIRTTYPSIVVIGLSQYRDRQFAEAMLQAGASACLAKDRVVEELPAALRSASRRQTKGRPRPPTAGGFHGQETP
jgi:DNA-binding NarL/FixJ family response regulator